MSGSWRPALSGAPQPLTPQGTPEIPWRREVSRRWAPGRTGRDPVSTFLTPVLSDVLAAGWASLPHQARWVDRVGPRTRGLACVLSRSQGMSQSRKGHVPSWPLEHEPSRGHEKLGPFSACSPLPPCVPMPAFSPLPTPYHTAGGARTCYALVTCPSSAWRSLCAQPPPGSRLHLFLVFVLSGVLP